MCLVTTLVAPACRNKTERVGGSTPTASAAKSATPPSALKAPTPVPPVPMTQMPWKAATGVTLPIFIGRGIGPIRFGAHMDTVERLMGVKCQAKTKTLCRMSDRGVNFHFNDKGELEEIFIARADRIDEKEPSLTFGMFNGVFERKRASIGMLPEAIVELIGEPKETVKLDGAGPNKAMLRQVYESMVLDYDLQTNGKLALSAISLRKGAEPPAPAGPTKHSAPSKQ